MQPSEHPKRLFLAYIPSETSQVRTPIAVKSDFSDGFRRRVLRNWAPVFYYLAETLLIPTSTKLLLDILLIEDRGNLHSYARIAYSRLVLILETSLFVVFL
jgi:hypothetical protein